MGQQYSVKEKNQAKEMHRRITTCRAEFNRNTESLQTQHCYLSEETGVQLTCAATIEYGANTWTITMQALYNLLQHIPKWHHLETVSYLTRKIPTQLCFHSLYQAFGICLNFTWPCNK